MDYFIVLLLLVLYVILTLYEAVLLQSSKNRLDEEFPCSGRKLKKLSSLLDAPGRFLNYIRIDAELCAVFAGVFFGILVVSCIPGLSLIYFHNFGDDMTDLAIVAIVAAMVCLILSTGRRCVEYSVFKHPEKILSRLYWVARAAYFILWPLAWIIDKVSTVIMKLFGVDVTVVRAMTQEEIMTMLNKSSQHGVLDKEESEMIRDVFDFSDSKVNELMTPRKDVVGIDIETGKDTVLNIMSQSHFSKYPVLNGSLDEVVGILCVKDVLNLVANGSEFEIASIMTRPLYIPETLEARKVLEMFKKEKQKFGIVVDEYGGMEGIITLHDLVESIFGDIYDEYENEEQEVVPLTDGSYVVDGTMNIDDFMEYMGIEDDEITSKDFTTVGGMTTFLVGEIPSEGVEFDYRNLKMKVLKMDGRRVDKISVAKNETMPEE